MKVPILSGVFTDLSGDIRTSYPRNLVPVALQSGINNGYLRPAPGIELADPAVPSIAADRGGAEWRGEHYRVRAGRLTRILPTGAVVDLGALPGILPDVSRASFAVGFDRLAVAVGGRLFYYDGTAVIQVTDPDLGDVFDVTWQGGYFITTDGEFIVTTELGDPTQVSPLKYASAETDPDPIVGVGTHRNEVYAFGRYTTEVFQNVGGAGFPFAVVQGALVTRGAISAQCAISFGETWAFLGSGRSEPLAVWAVNGGATQRLSTREIERVLATYPESDYPLISLESRTWQGHEWLYVHLPDRTFVFDLAASVETQQQVWFELGSSLVGPARYDARGFVWAHNRWWCAHPADGRIGVENDTIGMHWGQHVGWQVDTQALYGEGRAAIVHEIELVALQGRAPVGEDASIWNSYSDDGLQWSNERAVRAGRTGQTTRRLVWRGQGRMRHWRIQRFRGTSETHTTLVRLEMGVEPLNA